MGLSLFDLNREFRNYTVEDGSGQKFEVCLRAIDHASNMKLLYMMDEKRGEIDVQVQDPKIQKGLHLRVNELSIDSLQKQIIQIEKPTVISNIDLAPSDNDESLSQDEREKKALAEWETHRTAELAAMSKDDLREILFERQQTLFSQIRLVEAFTDYQLELMVVDPKTYEPLLSAYDTAAANYIGKLMPQTRKALIDLRQKFLDETSDKSIREGADDPNFLSSGDSAKKPESSPGEMIETP